MIKNLERITSDYQRMWNESQDQLRAGDIDPDPVPDNTSRRWGVSLVIRPTEPVLSRLAAVAKEVTQFTGNTQITYDQTNLHTTVRSIEPNRLEVDEHDEKIQQYAAALQTVVKKFGPITIAYKGLTANRSGIMAQGWPVDDTLQNIREAFHAELGNRGLLGGPEEQAVRQTAHASLAVFTHALSDPEGLANYVQNNRDTDYGTCTVTNIDLIKYDRAESSVSMLVFATCSLSS